jgi:hypothetical protein
MNPCEHVATEREINVLCINAASSVTVRYTVPHRKLKHELIYALPPIRLKLYSESNHACFLLISIYLFLGGLFYFIILGLLTHIHIIWATHPPPSPGRTYSTLLFSELVEEKTLKDKKKNIVFLLV